MSTEADDSIHKTVDYFYQKMNKGYNKYINSKKNKFKKRAELIKYLDSFNQAINYNEYLSKNHNSKNNEISAIPNIKSILSYQKSNTSNNSSNNFNNVNNNSSNLHINLTSSYFNKKEKNSNNINLKTSFNNFYIKQKIFFDNNTSEIRKKNEKYQLIYNSPRINSNKKPQLKSNSFDKKSNESQLKFSPFLKTHKSSNLVTFNNINTSFNKKKIKLNKSKKNLNPFKYSNNYIQNCILKQILKNPNLKLLYDTDENRAKKSVKSQNESNKKKLSLIKYQSNLIENALIPLDRGEELKLIKSFNKINLSVGNKKKIELNKYLREIQRKEKELIEDHNEIEDNYGKNIEKIGFSPIGKRKIHIGRMKFIDAFLEVKKRNKYKNIFN